MQAERERREGELERKKEKEREGGKREREQEPGNAAALPDSTPSPPSTRVLGGDMITCGV